MTSCGSESRAVAWMSSIAHVNSRHRSKLSLFHEISWRIGSVQLSTFLTVGGSLLPASRKLVNKRIDSSTGAKEG